ncbi:hypothetical protein RUM43_002516 [Polyplax serrata]|uniref:Uncharacterized protein n=1 Tax=Polyplax serrata TaxID=468196 RepID=A0AAN8S980_POLSC
MLVSETEGSSLHEKRVLYAEAPEQKGATGKGQKSRGWGNDEFFSVTCTFDPLENQKGKVLNFHLGLERPKSNVQTYRLPGDESSRASDTFVLSL